MTSTPPRKRKGNRWLRLPETWTEPFGRDKGTSGRDEKPLTLWWGLAYNNENTSHATTRPDTQPDSKRTRQVHSRADRRQASGRYSPAQSPAPPACARGDARRYHTQEHHDDRPHGRRQDRDRPPRGQADQRAFHKGRGD